MNNRDAYKEHYSLGTDENPIVKDGFPYVYSSTGKLVRRLDFDPETMEIFTLNHGEGLSEEQKAMLETASKLPIVYDEDCPKSSPEQLERMKQYGLDRNKKRREHTDAYYRFQEFREEMLKKNPMTDEEINNIINNDET